MLVLNLITLSRRAFSSKTLKPLKNVPSRHRAATLSQARSVLTEYLHVTRSLQFCHAENIAANSPSSLSSLLSRFTFPDEPSQLHAALRRFLSFRPVNEFDFFFESIGLHRACSPRGIFLSDDSTLVAAVTALVQFGFPWTKLGILYSERDSIFTKSAEEIGLLLSRYEKLGFVRVAVIGICLAFPNVLASDGEAVSLIFEDLRILISDFRPEGSAEENVEIYFRLCRRIKVFYSAGCEIGAVGEILAASRNILFKVEEEDIKNRINFFSRLGMSGKEAGTFLLRNPEVFPLDLENPSVRMPDYLKQIGLCEDLDSLSVRFPYAMGKNRLSNLPAILKSMGLCEIFVKKIRNGHHYFLNPDPVPTVPEDNDFQEELSKARLAAKSKLVTDKLEFLLEIGFGENKITLKTLRNINSSKNQLMERFHCLLQSGLDYSMACRMLCASPKLINQNAEMLKVKIDHLRNNLGCSIQYLDNFPAYLCFDLENRVKPRYRILNWLKEAGLLKKTYSPATVLATSEKKFVVCLHEIHPAAPKQWLEVFSRKKG